MQRKCGLLLLPTRGGPHNLRMSVLLNEAVVATLLAPLEDHSLRSSYLGGTLELPSRRILHRPQTGLPSPRTARKIISPSSPSPEAMATEEMELEEIGITRRRRREITMCRTFPGTQTIVTILVSPRSKSELWRIRLRFTLPIPTRSN